MFVCCCLLAATLIEYHALQTLSTTFLFFLNLFLLLRNSHISASTSCHAYHNSMCSASQLCYNSMRLSLSQHKIRQKIKLIYSPKNIKLFELSEIYILYTQFDIITFLHTHIILKLKMRF